MPIDLKLTDGHDLDIVDGDAVLVEAETQSAQHCKIRLLTWRPEWILDYTLGVPYIDGIYSRSKSQEFKDQKIKDTIRNTPGVKEILEYTFGMDYENLTASIEFSATTEDGDIIVEVKT
jgi:hypothetical protein